MRPAGYWRAALDPPAGASRGFVAVLDAAEQAIQNCADLMAAGEPGAAPNMLEMFRSHGLVRPGGQALLVDNYSTKLAEVGTVEQALQRQHRQMMQSADKTYDASSTKLRAIKFHTQALQMCLRGPYPLDRHGRLPAQTEAKLLEYVLDTVEDVFRETESAVSWIGEESVHIDTGTSELGRAQATAVADTRTDAPAGMPSMPMFPMLPLDDDRDRESDEDDDRRRPEYVAAEDSDYARYSGSMSTNAAISGALDALDIEDPEARENWTRGYQVLIARESGGNPNAVNNWDSNAAAGQNSRGLTQTIPGTFRAYHVRGTSTDIHDPVANVAASMNYVMHRYDVQPDGSNLQSAVQQTDPGRPAKGY